MSTLKATNIKNESSASNNIVLDSGGGVVVSGILTATSFSGNVNATTSIGINTSSPKSALDLSQATNGIALPQGTTAQRPTGSTPYLRWNTSNNALEFYNGTDWVEIISDYFPSGSTILG